MTRRTVLNVVLNTGGTAAAMLAGFLVLPFLIGQLGKETYGLWTLIATLTGYFSVLDLGVAGSVGRQIAFHRARGNLDGVNTIVSTALAILSGVFVLGCLATAGAAVVFFWIFDVPADQVADVRFALILVGLNLALTFPANVFAGLFWGYERFDLQNAVEIPVVVVRTVLTFLLIGNDAPLTTLAWIVFGVNFAGALARAGLCWWLEPRLRIRRGNVRRGAVGEIYSYGIWYFLLSLSRTLIPQIGPTVIGMRLGNGPVTIFTIARQVTAYTNSFLITATQVMTPRATALHAEENHAQQRTLFLDGGRYALALTLFFVIGFTFLGQPFLELWQKGAQEGAYQLLMILIAGEALPMSQWLTYSTILGMGRHRPLAGYAVAEGLATLALALFLVGPMGLVGIAVAAALPGFVFRGVCQWLYGCRLIDVSPWHYARRVFGPVLLMAVVPAAALATLTQWRLPSTWPELVGMSVAYALVFAVSMGYQLLGSLRRASAGRPVSLPGTN
jgi:O-antigen/teichoic acid export membrane protein